MAARCFLINTGLAILTYGYRPDALLTSQPTLYAADEELVISDPGSYRQQPIEDAVLGAKRTVEEMRALVKAVKQLPPDLPTLAFVDGSLIMLGLVGALNQDFVLRELVEQGFVRALEELEEMARSRALAVAGYVSLPGSAEVVSGIRAATCPYELEGGSYRCSFYGLAASPATVAWAAYGIATSSRAPWSRENGQPCSLRARRPSSNTTWAQASPSSTSTQGRRWPRRGALLGSRQTGPAGPRPRAGPSTSAPGAVATPSRSWRPTSRPWLQALTAATSARW